MSVTELELRALATDQRLLEPMCTFVDHGDYLLYRSSRFPTYYGGNGLELRDPMTRSLAGWERVFRQAFPRATYVHETLTLRYAPAVDPLIDAARAAGYHVDFEHYMVLQALRLASRDRLSDLRRDLSVELVRTEAGWERMEAFHRRTAEGEDWFDPDTDDDQLMLKTRAVSDAIGVEWYLLEARGEPLPVARAGMFFHEGMCRLQDVETHPAQLRQGHASHLLRFMIARALSEMHVDAVCVCADENDPALALYDSLGFQPIGRHVTLMRYPPATT